MRRGMVAGFTRGKFPGATDPAWRIQLISPENARSMTSFVPAAGTAAAVADAARLLEMIIFDRNY